MSICISKRFAVIYSQWNAHLHSFHALNMANSTSSVWSGTKRNSVTRSRVCSSGSQSPSSAREWTKRGQIHTATHSHQDPVWDKQLCLQVHIVMQQIRPRKHWTTGSKWTFSCVVQSWKAPFPDSLCSVWTRWREKDFSSCELTLRKLNRAKTLNQTLSQDQHNYCGK